MLLNEVSKHDPELMGYTPDLLWISQKGSAASLEMAYSVERVFLDENWADSSKKLKISMKVKNNFMQII